ncbi:hypothetical protein [Ectopseudomonas hydrolytica]|uniref:hypothetical protein n=1 Tax=Ectopseudomonas hydrolytica TaxID=2493633 RepID=UPI002356F517|nr:hypothetical protein [Pseudomonas sp.]MBA4243094.1 hypothetical protein [Pseudomonas sp.]
MRIPVLAVLMLAVSASTLSWAQEPIRTPAAPAPGAPGTSTPQPYGQPSTTPIRPQGSPPLLPPPQGQSMPGSVPRTNSDQSIPQLDQQLRRNSQGLEGQRQQN